MYPDPDHHHLPYKAEGLLRPDRRPLPQAANEIRMRVKRALSKREA
jgi:hypothetical protein